MKPLTFQQCCKNVIEHVSLSLAFVFSPVIVICVSLFSSVHLYYLFPSLEEGGLATYRTAIVQNQHLAMLAKVNVYLMLEIIQHTVNYSSKNICCYYYL